MTDLCGDKEPSIVEDKVVFEEKQKTRRREGMITQKMMAEDTKEAWKRIAEECTGNMEHGWFKRVWIT